MKWNHMSKILTEEEQKKINKLDWYLILASKEIDKVSAMFERIKSLGGEYKEITLKYEKLISFKLKQARQISMSIEEDIFNSAFDLYKQHYGLFKNKNALLEEREIKLSYEFESFLTQLKTILDLFFKYLGELELNQKIGRIDSFEKITREFERMKFNKKGNRDYRQAESKIKILKKEHLLKEIFKNFNTLYEIKIYRDYIIHHGNIVQDKYISPEERYLQYNYGVPNLTKSKKGYRINKKSTRRLDYFCRLKLLEEIYIIWTTLSRVINQNKLNLIKKEFFKYSPKDIENVLRFVGRKALWNDKSMIKEEKLKKILKTRNFNFKDLVKEETRAERMFENLNNIDGKDMSYIIKRTLFKPLGYFQINKIEHIYDRDWTPPNNKLNLRYGLVDMSFGLNNFKKNERKIIDLLNQLGLVIHLIDEDKYTLINKDLERFIAILIGLSQFKWMFVNNPSFNYFRKLNLFEKETLKKIFGTNFKEQIKEIDKKRKEIDENSQFYKMQKSLLEESKEKYLEMVKKEKENCSKVIREFNYLKPALRLINEDIFLKNPKLN